MTRKPWRESALTTRTFQPGGLAKNLTKNRVFVLSSTKKLEARWKELPNRVGLEAAQQFYDHIAQTPGQPPSVGTTTILKAKPGRPKQDGFSRTVHYEISGAGRIDYQYNDSYVGKKGDPHGVVCIIGIDHSSH